MRRLVVTVATASLAVAALVGAAGSAAADDVPRVLPGAPGDIKVVPGNGSSSH